MSNRRDDDMAGATLQNAIPRRRVEAANAVKHAAHLLRGGPRYRRRAG